MGYFGQFDPMTIFGHSRTALSTGMKIEMPTMADIRAGANRCEVHCTSMTWDENEVLKFQELVRENYSYRMIVDDLPSATTLPGSHAEYTEGVPLGYQISESQPLRLSDGNILFEAAILNHLDIKILLHPALLT